MTVRIDISNEGVRCGASVGRVVRLNTAPAWLQLYYGPVTARRAPAISDISESLIWYARLSTV